MSKNKGGRAAILFVLVGGLGVGALAYYVKSTPNASRVPDEVRMVKIPQGVTSSRPPEIETEKPRPKKASKAAEAETVRLPVFGDDIADMELAAKETTVPGGGDAMRFVAGRIAEAAHLDGARVLGVEVRDHVAFVSYNDAVQQGMGSMNEGAFLKALQIGFGQFSSVDKVAVEANGHPLESGHVDLSEPLAVIRPGEKPAPDETHGEP